MFTLNQVRTKFAVILVIIRFLSNFNQFTSQIRRKKKNKILGEKNNSFQKIGKLIVPSEAEIESNARSRSARLRIAEKIA